MGNRRGPTYGRRQIRSDRSSATLSWPATTILSTRSLAEGSEQRGRAHAQPTYRVESAAGRPAHHRTTAAGAQARLAQSAGRSRRRRHRWLTRGWWQLVHRPGAALTRALIIGAMLAAMHLAGITAVAHAQATDQQATRRPLAERQVGESWRHRQAASQDQSAADATLKRAQARERFSIPNATPAKVPAPVPPKPSGQPGRLAAWLGGLVAALALTGGLAVLAAMRVSRRVRAGQAT
jgi:hypothetical protein